MFVIPESNFTPSYPIDLDTAGKAIEGYVNSEAEVGSKVPITLIDGVTFKEKGEAIHYLQVIIRSGIREPVSIYKDTSILLKRQA